MTKTVLLRVGIGSLFVLYPFLVYFGFQEFQPRVIAGFLLVLTVFRFLLTKDNTNGQSDSGMSLYWIATASLVIVVTFLTGSKLGLFLYPLLVNLAFFTFFTISLYHPPTIIERIARRQRKEFPERAIVYTRKVTKVWCVFFLLNGSVSALTIFHSETWWMLYNGFISYILIGLMLGGEYLVRLRVMKHSND
jgi:uncharacterized membrane protein